MDTLLIAYWLLGDNHFSKDLYTTVLVQGLFLDHQILEGFWIQYIKNMKPIPDSKNKNQSKCDGAQQ